MDPVDGLNDSRRMNQTAANLVNRVLPGVPARQWVHFPMPLRFWLARRPKPRKVIRGVFARVVHSGYRKQARAAGHGPTRPGPFRPNGPALWGKVSQP